MRGPERPAPGERRTLLLGAARQRRRSAWSIRTTSGPSLCRARTWRHRRRPTRCAAIPQFRVLFLTPSRASYFYPGTGLNAAGLAYFPLALLGVVSFAAAQWVGCWRWERALLWAAFFALSMWHARAIPFFAVVAGPIASLNFLDFVSGRIQFRDKFSAGIWALGGRFLTLLAGLILLALSWPGWLQAQPWEGRRVGWTVTPNPALRQTAEQITNWHKNDLMRPGAHWFNTAPDVLYYLAWYCPGERAFIDNQRWSLYDRATAEDFAVLRKSLARGRRCGVGGSEMAQSPSRP